MFQCFICRTRALYAKRRACVHYARFGVNKLLADVLAEDGRGTSLGLSTLASLRRLEIRGGCYRWDANGHYQESPQGSYRNIKIPPLIPGWVGNLQTIVSRMMATVEKDPLEGTRKLFSVARTHKRRDMKNQGHRLANFETMILKNPAYPGVCPKSI